MKLVLAFAFSASAIGAAVQVTPKLDGYACVGRLLSRSRLHRRAMIVCTFSPCMHGMLSTL